MIARLDHLAATVRECAGGRKAPRFGRAKTNLHQAGAELEPKATRPTSDRNRLELSRYREGLSS